MANGFDEMDEFDGGGGDEFARLSNAELYRQAYGGGTDAGGAAGVGGGDEFAGLSNAELYRQAFAGPAKREEAGASLPEPERGERGRSVYGRVNLNALPTHDELAAKGERGGVETAMLNRQEKTGIESDYDGSWWGGVRDASQAFAHAVFGHPITNAMNANLQALARGTYTDIFGNETPLEQLPDATLDYVMDNTGANGFAGVRALLGERASHAWRGEDNIMRQWDEREGAKFADEAERKRARVAYAKELAQNMISMQEESKLAASDELAAREETFKGALGRGLLEQGGYTARFMIGKYGFIAGVLEGVERAGELLSDKTKVDKNGEIVADAKRDTMGAALAKGAARGVIAPAVELVGGKLLMAGAKGAVRNTLGRIPLVKAAGGKLAATAAGKSVAAFARKMDYVRRMTGMGSFPEEMAEEWEDQVLDAAIGLDRRASENAGTTALGRARESNAQFFTAQNFGDLAKSMILMQVIQGGAAHALDRMNARRVDAVLENVCGVERGKLRNWTANQKQQAFTAWVEGLSEENVRNMVDGGSRALNRFMSEMFGGHGMAPVALKDGEGRTVGRALVRTGRGGATAGEVNEALGEIRRAAGENDFTERDADGNPVERRFTPQTTEDGKGGSKPMWTPAQDEAGNPVLRLVDAENGVTIDSYDFPDDDAPTYRVYDARGRQRAADGIENALAYANGMVADLAQRNAKLRYIRRMAGDVLRNQRVFVGDTMADVRRDYDAQFGAGAFDRAMKSGDGQYIEGEGDGEISGASFWMPETDADGKSTLVPATDRDGNPVYETDAKGKPVLDAAGNPVRKMVRPRAVFFALDSNRSVAELNATAYHEVARHSGLAQMYTPEEKADFLRRLSAGSFGDAKNRMDWDGLVRGQMAFRGKKSEAELWKDPDAVEEIFAVMTEGMTESPSLKQRFMANVYDWYRNRFKQNLDIQPDELAVVVDELNRFARRGGGAAPGGGVTYQAREGRELEGDLANVKEMRAMRRDAANARPALPYTPDAAEGTREKTFGEQKAEEDAADAALAERMEADRAEEEADRDKGGEDARQTRKNAPVSAPTEAGTTTQPRDAARAEGRKSGDAAVAAFDRNSTVLSGDEVRKTMPGYDPKDWRTHVDRTGYVGPHLEAQFRHLLKTRKGKGNGTVVFLAGGNGVGKSTFAQRLGGTPDFTIDSTLGNLDATKRQIDAILANGEKPIIAFVYRNPREAIEGIRNRVANGGHTVSPLSFANSHVKSRDNLRLLSEAYGDKIDIRIYDNSVPNGPRITPEQLEEKERIDHEELRRLASEHLGKEGRLAGSDRTGSVHGSGAKGEGAGRAEGGAETGRADRVDNATEGQRRGGDDDAAYRDWLSRTLRKDTPENRAKYGTDLVAAVADYSKALGRSRNIKNTGTRLESVLRGMADGKAWRWSVPARGGGRVRVNLEDALARLDKAGKLYGGDGRAVLAPFRSLVEAVYPSVSQGRKDRVADVVRNVLGPLWPAHRQAYKEENRARYAPLAEERSRAAKRTLHGAKEYAEEQGDLRAYADAHPESRIARWLGTTMFVPSEGDNAAIHDWWKQNVGFGKDMDRATARFLAGRNLESGSNDGSDWWREAGEDLSDGNDGADWDRITHFLDALLDERARALEWAGKTRGGERAAGAEGERTPSWYGKAEEDMTEGERNAMEAFARDELDEIEGANYDVTDDPHTLFRRSPSGAEAAERTRREYNEVVARYTNPDGTKRPGWMHAPNGKPTRLTERQWVQVRTPSFKKWFGDWERLADLYAARDFALNSEPVAEVSGNDFQKDPTGANTLIDRVADYFAGFGGKAESPDLGTVELTRRGVKSSVAHGIGAKKAAAFAAVKDVIEKGVVFDRNDDWKGRGYATAAIAAPIRMGGKDYVCELIVNRYKDRNAFYLHEVNLKEKLSDTIKTATGAVSIGESARPVMSIIAQRLAEVNPASVSKVVDENGEPQVVYHGHVDDFTVFKPSERGKLGKGVYLSAYKEKAGRYSRIKGKFGYGHEKVMSLFVNIRNPYVGSGERYDEGLRNALTDNSYDGIISDKNMVEIVARNPAQVKSATDNTGAFAPANPDIRFSVRRVTPEEDAAYMDAVKRGDTEAAEKMERDAVARAMPDTKVVGADGKPMKVYHGSRTGANIKIFRTPSFFSDNRDVADMFKKEADFILRVNGKEVAIDDVTARQIADELTGGDYTPDEMANWGSFAESIRDIEDNGKGYGGRDVIADALGGVGIDTPLDEITEMSFMRVPDIYECYVNITNPLEIDFKGKTWGQEGTKEMEAAVRDAAKNGYDGVIVRNIREGGFLGELRNGEEPPLSTDYIPVIPNQIKLADAVTRDDAGNVIPLSQRFDQQNPDIRFSVRRMDDAARRRNLLAVHNISLDGIRKVVELGGFAMPSIAVVRDDYGHSEFGDCTVLFAPSTIDPRRDRRNTIYSHDAWTPTFPAVYNRIDEDGIARTNRAIIQMVPEDVYRAIGNDHYKLNYLDGIHDAFDTAEDAADAYAGNAIVKAAYLVSNGETVTPVMVKKNYFAGKKGVVGHLDENMIAELESRLGDRLVAAAEGPGAKAFSVYERLLPEVRRLIRTNDAYVREKLDATGDDAFSEFEVSQIADVVSAIRADKERGEYGKKVVSEYATRRNISGRVDENDPDYRAWINAQYGRPILGKGIYNGRERFTAQGRKRAWDALHDELTLENVVRAMKKTQPTNGSGILGRNPFGVAVKKFSSIGDLKKSGDGILRNLTRDEDKSIKEELTARLGRLVSRYMETNEHQDANRYIEYNKAVDMMFDAFEKAHGRLDAMKRGLNGFGYSADDGLTREIMSVFSDISVMPTNYFEAKPQRAVRFDEMKAWIVPDSISPEDHRLLDERGQRVFTYRNGDETDRLRAVNEAADQTDVRFSIRVNPRLREEVEAALAKDADGHYGVSQGKVVRFADNLPILNFLGVKVDGVFTTADRLRKMAGKHHLGGDQIASLIERADAPAAVFLDIDGNGSNVILTDTMADDGNGTVKPVMVLLRPAKRGAGEYIASAYARTDAGEGAYIAWKTRLRYLDENKIAGLGLKEETDSQLKPSRPDEDVKTPEEFTSWRSTANSVAQPGAGAQGPDVRFSIPRLYTGSAADYERPSLHAIGTGEGNQAYGWGLYASNRRGVAESYAKINDGLHTFDGRPIEYISVALSPQERAIKAFTAANGDKNRARETLVGNAKRARGKSRKEWDDAVEWFDENGGRLATAKPHLYEQTWFTDRAPGDESQLLKWYEPVSEENVGRIQKQADSEGIGQAVRDALRYGDGYDGKDVYHALSRNFGSSKAASEFLARAGIDGVKYPVDSYGKAVKDGDKAGWNYVSFRDDNIRVDHKWRDGGMVFRRVTDKSEIARLENDPKGYTEAYASAQVIDGKVYSPMAAYIDGKLTEPFGIGEWQKSEEHPELADASGNFKLDKTGRSKDAITAKYNPYWHSVSLDSPLNDQFSTDYARPNLVMIKVRIPNSDLLSGYRAENAKDPVGALKWKSGDVTNALKRAGKPDRTVFLSRYRQVLKVLSNEEAARLIARQLEGVDIRLPANVVTPAVRDLLVGKYGVRLGEPTGNANARAKYARELREQGVRFRRNTNDNLREDVASALNTDRESGKVISGHSVVEFSDTPVALLNAGIPDGRIYTHAYILRKIEKKHDIDLNGIVSLVDAISEPAALLRDNAKDGYIVLTKQHAKDINGRNAPVMVYLRPDGKGNFIASAYSKTENGERQFTNLINAGGLLSVDKNKIADLNLTGEVKSSFESAKVGNLFSSVPQSSGTEQGGVALRNRRYTPDPAARLLADALGLSAREAAALAAGAANAPLGVGNDRRDSMPGAARDLVDAVSDEEGIAAAFDTTRNLVGRLFGKGAAERWRALRRGLRRRLTNYLEPVVEMQRLVERRTLHRVRVEDSVADAAKFAYSHQTRMWEDAEREVLAPLYKEIAENGLDAPAKSIGEGTVLHELLLALHGPAFNRMISERTDGKTLDGSGASTAFWLGVLRGHGANGTDAQLLGALARGDYAALGWAGGSVGAKAAKAVSLVRELTNRTRDVLERSGRLGAKQRATWEALSPFYVPMRFDLNADDNFVKVWLHGGTLEGGGYARNYAGGESRHAFGHRNIADNPIVFAVQQHADAIQRATDNDVRRKLADMVRRNEFLGHVVDADGIVDMGGVVNPRAPSGFVGLPRAKTLGADTKARESIAVGSLEQEDNIVAFKEGGDVKFIVLGPRTNASGRGAAEDRALSEAEARLVGRAVKKTSLAQVGPVLKFVRGLTRTFGQLRTTLSPEFLVSNFLADNAQAAGNVYATFGAKGVAQFERGVPAALASARRMLNGKLGTSRMDAYAREMREGGGLIGGLSTANFADVQRDVEREVAKFAGDRKVRVLDFISHMAERMNAPFEVASRLSAYAVCRENGMTRAEAAKYAREVTVDFNQKGEWTPVLNALYAFSNASLVDMERSFGAYAARRGLRLSFALVALGFLSSMLGYWQDDPDDAREGAAQWKDTKDYVKQNKLGFRAGTNLYSVPIRGVNRVLYYAGHKLWEVLSGRQGAGEAAWEVGSFAASNLVDPIGDAAKPLQAVTPSVLRPGMELLQNESFSGAQIYREPMNRRLDVRSAMGRRTTPGIWHNVAEAMNAVTGGNRNKRGAIDVQPEVYQYVYSWLTGSAGNDIARAANVVKDIATWDFSDMEDARNVPFVRRFTSGLQANTPTFREKMDEFNEDVKQFKDVANEDPGVMADLRARHPFFGASPSARRWLGELTDLGKAARKLMKAEMSLDGEDRKAAHRLRLQVQAAFIHRFGHAPEEDTSDDRAFARSRDREAAKVIKANRK